MKKTIVTSLAVLLFFPAGILAQRLPLLQEVSLLSDRVNTLNSQQKTLQSGLSELKAAGMNQKLMLDSLTANIKALNTNYADSLKARAAEIKSLGQETDQLNASLDKSKTLITTGFIIAALLLLSSLALLLALRHQIRKYKSLTEKEEDNIKTELHMAENRLDTDEKKLDSAVSDQQHIINQLRNDLDQMEKAHEAQLAQIREDFVAEGKSHASKLAQVREDFKADLNRLTEESAGKIKNNLAELENKLESTGSRLAKHIEELREKLSRE